MTKRKLVMFWHLRRPFAGSGLLTAVCHSNETEKIRHVPRALTTRVGATAATDVAVKRVYLVRYKILHVMHEAE